MQISKSANHMVAVDCIKLCKYSLLILISRHGKNVVSVTLTGCWSEAYSFEHIRNCWSVPDNSFWSLVRLVRKIKNIIEWQICKRKCIVDKKDQKNMGQASLSWQEGNSNSNNHSEQLCWAEKHFKIHNMFSLEVYGLQEQKFTLEPVLSAKDRNLSVHCAWNLDG